MGTTTKFGWRTPNPNDPNNVPVDMEELADDIEATVAGLDGELAPVRTGFIYLTTVYFESSGSFAKANFPGIKAVRAKAQGGGGGGGGTDTTIVDEASSSGGGGGGAYAERFVLATDLASTVPVTVGAGGAAGAPGADGGVGGTSSFGTHAVGPGGTGGFHRAPSTGFRGSSGATKTTGAVGDLTVDGGAGSGGFSFGTSVVSAVTVDKGMHGAGGSSFLGGTGRSARGPDVAPDVGTKYGGGGSGNVNDNSQAGKSGAAGGPGIVIVDVFV